VRAAVVLFVFAFALRALFVAAPHDEGPGWHAGFQGDAPVWQSLVQQGAAQQRAIADDAAHAAAERRAPRSELELARDGRLEAWLPVRPPGMQWLVGAAWNGDPARAGTVRWLFVALGAAIAPLVWLLLRPHVAPAVAFGAAALCAASSNLLLVASGLHVEGPYLLLALAALLLQPKLAGARAWPFALAWGAMHGALCLVRAEHVLTAVALAVLARLGGAGWRTLLAGTLAAAAVVAPWQLHANARIDAFNAAPQPEAPRALPWDDDALAALHALPAFTWNANAAFVGATVQARGGTRVRAADLGVLREAFGCWPEPLPHAFVALYGGLNFFLANTPEADGGFSAAALDRPPPLTGGDHRYPPGFRDARPRGGSLVFEYPPHLDAVVHGTRLGLAELAQDPAAGALRVGKKLLHALEGATGGAGGYALPIGLSGVRRQVDLVAATGAWAWTWRVLVLAAAAAGLWSLRRVRGLWPLFAFALTKVLVVAGWFGYARHGALCVPVIALGVAAAAAQWLPARRTRALGFAAAAALLALDTWRAFTSEGLATQPAAANDFAARPVGFR
jgi:hypothetical protein